MKASVILVSLLLASTAFAQTEGQTVVERADGNLLVITDQYDTSRLRIEYEQAVRQMKSLGDKRLAYTYDQVEDSTRPLPGGNEIKSQKTTSYARDADGRTRVDYSVERGVQRTAILDPTTHTAWLIRPERKDVLRMKDAALTARPATGAVRYPAPGTKTTSTHTELGEKEIAGFKAHGTRFETTIPAGQQGNEQPMVRATESWYAEDVAMTLAFTTSSPLTGTIVRHIDNLKVGDVPASTFAVPEGYAIRDVVLDQH